MRALRAARRTKQEWVEKFTPCGFSPVTVVTPGLAGSGLKVQLQLKTLCLLRSDPCFFPLGRQESTISSKPLSGSVH